MVNKMEKVFLLHGDVEYTYRRLLADLNHKKDCASYLYIKENNPYTIFLSIIHSLVYDYPIEILDGDFSEEELGALGIELGDVARVNQVENPIVFEDIGQVIIHMEELEKWQLTLYTSGTTGRPKKVRHSLRTLCRNVKKHDKFNDDVWAFAFNPTHMAGVQVFFQAFFNQNTMIYVFGEPLKELPDLIESYQITSISATPTFYRNAMLYLHTKAYPSVRQVTFGGEKYDRSLGKTIKKTFLNAKISNIYASTESGSLFTAQGDAFEIRTEHQGVIKVTEQNELLIHQSLLGESKSFLLKDGWFHTGDFVEMIDDAHFKFISRETDMINIGGYKVNPEEVEAVLGQVSGVKNVLVKGKKNSVTGEIIVADVIKSDEVDGKELKKEIKQCASSQLQEWKVPRIIKFVDELPMTRTGKKVRK